MRPARIDRPASRWSRWAATAPGVHIAGLPVAFALTGAKADERETLLDMLAIETQLTGERPGQNVGKS